MDPNATTILPSSRPATPQRGRPPKSRDDRAGDPRMATRVREENPFLLDDEEFLPHVPDTKDWHYKWMRGNLGDKADGRNIIRTLRSKFQYEVVKPSDIPEFMPNAVDRKDLGGECIQFNDVILVRCPRKRYLQWLEAQTIRTNASSRAAAQQMREKFSERYSADKFSVEDGEQRVMEEVERGTYETDAEFVP